MFLKLRLDTLRFESTSHTAVSINSCSEIVGLCFGLSCSSSGFFSGEAHGEFYRLKTWSWNLISPVISLVKLYFQAQQFGSTYAYARCVTRVILIVSQSPDTKTLTLKANRKWQWFFAGQHYNITATIAGRNITQSYINSSDLINTRRIQITVRRGSSGLMSEYLCDDIGLGDQLELRNPFGNLLLPMPMRTQLFLLALLSPS